MNEKEFKQRTFQIALKAIQLVETLPQNRTSEVIGKQLIRSATSVGANYRSACRGKSTADVIHKLSIVEEEADETIYWLELIVESGLLPLEKVTKLKSEINEILAMTVASIKTLRLKSQTHTSKSKI
ncbi:four helix bundle protein [Scytonema sp. UIC 10036]|uniref:four helix bundle protein n=1 Tax=Scytonema sp. UIC 10036 TaxID=2304196 RepID=UPI0012DA2EEA|nr:four helix bundle protein [Scytonema sp. UIC 10036]MUG98540.1 four helix bundle protein [Scytonema sp. UIC 10036]